MHDAISKSARIHALVPCAGSGARAGARQPKQYVVVFGRTVVAHTLAALVGVRRLASILVALAPGDADGEAVSREGVDDPRLAFARCGGATRAATVAGGLDALCERGAVEADWVLVHDAARCLLRAAWVDRLIDACLSDRVGGLLALPVADTLKAGSAGRVVSTLDRRDAWQAQTPQMFRVGVLREALTNSGAAITDEASAMEARGYAPLLVPGELENFKLTQPTDFALAERLLSSRVAKAVA